MATAKYAEYKSYCENTLGIKTENVQVADLPYPFGRGLVLGGTKPARKGAVLLSVPVSALINIQCCNEGTARKFFAAVLSEIKMPEDDQLALYLLFEKALGSASKWAGHFAQLPAEYDNALYFDNSELKALEGTGLISLAVAGQAQVKADFEGISAVVEKHGAAFGLSASKGTFTLELFRWAYATVWSRGASLRVGPANAVLKCIAPFFDMANHDPNSKNTHTFDSVKRTLNVVCEESGGIHPGQQVLLNYGQVSSRDSIFLRGFVTPGNQHDSLQVQVRWPATMEAYDKRVEALRAHPPEMKGDMRKKEDREEAGTLRLAKGGPSPHLEAKFECYPDAYNCALHRLVAVGRCPTDKLDELIAGLKKDKYFNVGVEAEIDTFGILAKSLYDMHEELGKADDEGEKAHLLALTSDFENGRKAMEAYTRKVQAAIGFTAPPAASSASHDSNADASNDADDDDDDFGSALAVRPTASSKGKGGGKGKGKKNNKQHQHHQSVPAPTASTGGSNDAGSSGDAVSQDESTPVFTFSDAANDSHVRRLQMAAYLRNSDRRILASMLQHIDRDSDMLKATVEAWVAENQPEAAGGAAAGGDDAVPELEPAAGGAAMD